MVVFSSGQTVPVPAKHNDEIVSTLTGTAAILSALAVNSWPFIIGAFCWVVVAIRILKAQGN